MKLIRGAASLFTIVLGVAVIAAIPIVNLIALGYLLEVEGRVARGLRLVEAFPLGPVGARLGGILVGTWLWLLPPRLLWGAWQDAQIIDPQGTAARTLAWIFALTAAMVGAQLALVMLDGGRFSAFFHPLDNLRAARARVTDPAPLLALLGRLRSELRPLDWLSLGARGFGGAFLWLLAPAALLAASTRWPVLAILGMLASIPVLVWLPFLQARFAQEDRFGAFFDHRSVALLQRKAPVAWLLAALATYVLTLPLYLLKALVPPADAAWLVTLVFTASILPVRLLSGWAYGRATRATGQAPAALSFVCRWALVPAIGIYAVLLFLTPWIDAHGTAGLFAQHAFLLPTPF